jgi:uncharacterized protein YbbK (DUF523 family)
VLTDASQTTQRVGRARSQQLRLGKQSYLVLAKQLIVARVILKRRSLSMICGCPMSRIAVFRASMSGRYMRYLVDKLGPIKTSFSWIMQTPSAILY